MNINKTSAKLHSSLYAVPYDGKSVTLSEPRGKPSTTYINATEIQFSDLKQTFIATQAPKENTISNFWQMIIEKKESHLSELS